MRADSNHFKGGTFFMRHTTMLAVLAAAFTLSTAAAQPFPLYKPNRWEVSGFFGYGVLAGRNDFPSLVDGTSPNTVRLAREAGFLAGLRLSENLGEHFGAEFEYTFADSPVELRNLSPQLRNFVLEQRIHNFSYNGMFYLRDRRSRWRPFGTAGAGVSLYQLSGDTEQRGVAAGLDLRNRWKFAFSWGGGVKYLGGRQWGVRFDFRDRITQVPDYGIPREGMLVSGIQTPGFRPDGLFHHLEASVGFVYAFNVR